LPLIIEGVLPAEIFLESLFQCSPGFPFIIPQFDELISSRSKYELFLTFIDETDVVDPFLMGLDLKSLLDGVRRDNDFALLVGEVVDVN
jgi:hypothetical protein